MTDQPLPISAAERSRRYRERQRNNTHLITIEVDAPLLEGLISLGFVHADDSGERDCIEDAVFMLMEAVADDGIEIRDEWIESAFG